MEISEIRKLLLHCKRDKVVLLIQEKRNRSPKNGPKYFAVFKEFGLLLEGIEDSESPPETLRVQTSPESFREVMIISIESVRVVAHTEIEVFFKRCRQMIGSEQKAKSQKSPKQELVNLVTFWNYLWSIDLPAGQPKNKI